MSLSVTLTPGQLDELAENIAARMMKKEAKAKTYTVAEAAEILNVSYSTINIRIKAGFIRLIPNLGARRITQGEIDRLLSLDQY